MTDPIIPERWRLDYDWAKSQECIDQAWVQVVEELGAAEALCREVQAENDKNIRYAQFDVQQLKTQLAQLTGERDSLLEERLNISQRWLNDASTKAEIISALQAVNEKLIEAIKYFSGKLPHPFTPGDWSPEYCSCNYHKSNPLHTLPTFRCLSAPGNGNAGPM